MTAPTGAFAATADTIAAAALAVPGVEGLHGGPLGEVATVLPGRRIAGLRIGPDTCDVHVSLAWDADLRATADAIKAALLPLVGGRTVAVTVEDIGDPGGGPDDAAPTDGALGHGDFRDEDRP